MAVQIVLLQTSSRLFRIWREQMRGPTFEPFRIVLAQHVDEAQSLMSEREPQLFITDLVFCSEVLTERLVKRLKDRNPRLTVGSFSEHPFHGDPYDFNIHILKYEWDAVEALYLKMEHFYLRVNPRRRVTRV